MQSAPTSGRTNGKRLNGGGARLGGARADFVAGLGRKVADLRTVFAQVRAETDGAHADLRRRLANLASSAKMMKFDAMDRALGEAVGTMDRGKLAELDLDAIEQLIEDLPALAWGDGIARSSRAETAEHNKALPKREILVVGNAQIAEALRVEDGTRRSFAFTCETTTDAAAAYDLVRTTEPDLVVLDADIANAFDLVDALMDDPLTETVPIVVIGSFQEHGEASRFVAMGVAKTVTKPMTKHALRDVVEETLSPERGTLTAHAVLGEPTLEELGERLAQEVRDAIIGRADPSARSRRIALGQGTEVLGAVWGAIARVREVVTARTEGTIRFAGGPEGAITPALLLHEPARSDRETQKRTSAADVRLEGRRVVVADDDPAVVWFLADLLKTAGCEVLEAFDGNKALELAYASSPDLVISDILMPNMDGFSLCRALRRDVALRDTPVILLSWKEDLLQRVRELGAHASGYVRKESDTRAIIARVREALKGRSRIESRLREEGEVRGRLDGVSIKTLLEVVGMTRPDARVSVRDATFLYEVEIRDGVPRRITRTDADGGFVKGAAMLTQMLGVGAGRFAVVASSTPVEAELQGNLQSQLAKPVAKARAAMSLLTTGRVSSVTRVRFDEYALVDYLKATPEKARLVARRLANGAAPRELVLAGACEAALLDDILCDLAARGLIVGIDGEGGEDLLLPTTLELLQHVDVRADLPIQLTPQPLEPVNACADASAEPDCASPAAAAVEMFPFQSPSPEPLLADAVPEPVKPRAMTPSPTFYEATGTPPAEQIVALAEPTIVENTVYAPSAPDANDEEDDVYHSGAIAPGSEDEGAIPRAEMTPFELVTETSEEPQVAGMPSKARTWPMLAFITATGVVAWAVLHFTTHVAGTPKQQETQPPAVEMTLPAPSAPSAPTDQADKADDAFYRTLPAPTAVAEDKPADAGTKPKAAPKPTATEERDGDVRSGRFARVKF